MPLPTDFSHRLSLPAIAAPMFLVSGPELVIETCRAGVIGTFRALSQRTTDGYDAWLKEIRDRLEPDSAPFGVNLIVHRTNPRLPEDLAVTVKHEVPLVITSLGAVRDVVEAVHSYGGLGFHDVINLPHARKAAEAGAHGLIAGGRGAGGPGGNPKPAGLIPRNL